jgi:hypothetical protein
VYERRVVLDPIVTREVIETECPFLTEQIYAPVNQEFGECGRESITLLESANKNGSSELLSVAG